MEQKARQMDAQLDDTIKAIPHLLVMIRDNLACGEKTGTLRRQVNHELKDIQLRLEDLAVLACQEKPEG